MAGRGRQGKTGTLTVDQLAALGYVKNLPPVQSAVQTTFPPVMKKPIAVETTAAEAYQLMWKAKFLNRMRDSPYYIVSESQENSEQKKALGQAKVKKLPEFNYKTMPKELNMSNTKRHGEDPQPKLLTKKTNIEESLKVLEQTELKTGDEHEQDDAEKERDDAEKERDDAEKERDDAEKERDDAEKEQDDAESEQDDAEKESDMEQDDEMDDPEAALDHEMDDENDYGNSYFDNGEDYSEEDDNLSDGPVI
ncbi:DNA-directed RNA polymerase III subunit RPC7-like isoform X2 [Drosophila pseudoobscura]|uniref:DNA-directed RNA polymerase III subunit RPC7-like isoform X2 n=1 Tax=Drosophila pseudoobscura pseudoobscura TaxID=46245 RepID=A0A6I8V9F4_DROPS|nr:DNA-directed RNA polymerase III subunit RPC7 isoform X2 [Drosophila pseudoobscura]